MIIQVVQKVFREPHYVLLALATSAAVFAFAVWLPNLPLIVRVMGHSGISLSQKLDLPISLLGSIATNFTILSASYTIAIAILSGINIALVVYIVKRQKRALSATGVTAGTFGILSGATGMGCAACGSLVISSLLATAGGASTLTLLPLRGGEFGILGVALLGASTHFLTQHITRPPVCEVTI